MELAKEILKGNVRAAAKLDLMEMLKGCLMDRLSQVINQDDYLQGLVDDLTKRKG